MALLPVLKNLAVNAKCLYDLVSYEYGHEEDTLREEMRMKRNAWKAVLPDHPVAAWTDEYIAKCSVGEMRKKLAWCGSLEAYREVFPVVVRSFVLLLQDRSFPGVAYKYPVFMEYLDLINAVIGKEIVVGKLERDMNRLLDATKKWERMRLMLEQMTNFERRKICQDLFGEIGRFYLVVRKEVEDIIYGLEGEEDGDRFWGQEGGRWADGAGPGAEVRARAKALDFADEFLAGFLSQVRFWKEEMDKAGGEMTGMERGDRMGAEEVLEVLRDLRVGGGG